MIDCFVATIARADSPIVTPVTKLGGRPVFVAEVVTPHCRHCGRAMDFIGQIGLDVPLLSERFQMAYVFMCPGQLDERGCLLVLRGNPSQGANAVLLQAERGLALVPETDARYPDYRVTLLAAPEPDIDVSDFDLDETLIMQVTEATKIGGMPGWVQNNETPRCARCGKVYAIVAQINAEPDGPLPADSSLGPNFVFFDFGDVGIGYVFVCPDERSTEGLLFGKAPKSDGGI